MGSFVITIAHPIPAEVNTALGSPARTAAAQLTACHPVEQSAFRRGWWADAAPQNARHSPSPRTTVISCRPQCNTRHLHHDEDWVAALAAKTFDRRRKTSGRKPTRKSASCCYA